MHSITIKLNDTSLDQLDVLATQYIDDYKLRGKGKPPLTHSEWLSKTASGKQFMHDCMSYKYIKLTQTELTKLSIKLYYEAFNMKPRHSALNARAITLQEAKSAVIAELLAKAVQSSEKPVLTLIQKKNT